MIAKLKGLIDSFFTGGVILDVHGVGYQVFCSQKTVDQLPAEGEATSLLIETVIREDAFILYGFFDAQEKESFNLLTSVQGVGAKVGIAILSALSPADVFQAISTQDKTAFARADGVGPKLAGRLVNELKDKAGSFSGTGAVAPIQISNDIEDALSALVNLGYKRHEAIAVIHQVNQNENLSAQDLIKASLAQLSRRAS